MSGPPVFVLATSRSGSTLVRVLLDAHPDLAAPPEGHLARACEALERTWRLSGPERDRAVDGAPLPAEALAAIRTAASAPLDAYARSCGVDRWCEKSLDNVPLAGLLAQVFPDARFIALFRHALDMVLSGIEASTWGYGAYGFEPYVRESPGNVVAALVRYWCDRTEAIADAADAAPDRTVRVRYEDLVASPEAETARLVESVGLAPAPGLSEAAFGLPHDLGSGDHKLPFTSGVVDSSVGRGHQIPVGLLSAPLRARTNALLGRLGYPPIGDGWNLEPARPLRSGPDADTAYRAAEAEVLGGPPVSTACPHGDRVDPEVPPVAVVADDLGLAWCVDLDDGGVHRCPPGALERHPGRLLAPAGALRGVAEGTVNLGSLLRDGTLRARGPASLVAAVAGALADRRP